MRALLKILGFVVIMFAACFTNAIAFAKAYYIPGCHITIELPDEYKVSTVPGGIPVNSDDIFVALTKPLGSSKTSGHFGTTSGQLNLTYTDDICVLISYLPDIEEDFWNRADLIDLFASVLARDRFDHNFTGIEGSEHALIKSGELFWVDTPDRFGHISDTTLQFLKREYDIFISQDGFTPKSTNDNVMKKKYLLRNYSVLHKRKHIFVMFTFYDGALKPYNYTDSIVKSINFVEEQMNLNNVLIPLLDNDKFSGL